MLITIDKNPKRAKSFDELLKGKKPMGRQKGAHLKDIDIEQFITEHDCMTLFMEHPWIADVRLCENTLLRDTMAKTATNKSQEPNKWVIELATKLLNGTVEVQREVFVRAACNLIAIKMFSYYGTGQAFQLLVERYLGKGRKVRYGANTNQPSMLEPESVSVKH